MRPPKAWYAGPNVAWMKQSRIQETSRISPKASSGLPLVCRFKLTRSLHRARRSVSISTAESGINLAQPNVGWVEAHAETHRLERWVSPTLNPSDP
jgi:hypothetical protein